MTKVLGERVLAQQRSGANEQTILCFADREIIREKQHKVRLPPWKHKCEDLVKTKQVQKQNACNAVTPDIKRLHPLENCESEQPSYNQGTLSGVALIVIKEPQKPKKGTKGHHSAAP